MYRFRNFLGLSLFLAFALLLNAKSLNAHNAKLELNFLFNEDDNLAAETTKVINKVKPKISIIVDDLGDNSIIAKKIIQLPAPLTLAILPHTPFAKLISQLGSNQNHEIIMHLPMEATTRPDLLGPGALFDNMTEDLFETTFLNNAKSIPNLVGFNNHMGSLLTQDSEKMNWLMAIAQQKHWYFLDSKTSEDSIAQTAAQNIGLPNIGRDIFLDHFNDRNDLPKMLIQQFNKLKTIAKLRGHAVVICHPYPETLSFLAKKIPELNEDFELVHLSELLIKSNSKLAKLK